MRNDRASEKKKTLSLNPPSHSLKKEQLGLSPPLSALDKESASLLLESYNADPSWSSAKGAARVAETAAQMHTTT